MGSSLVGIDIGENAVKLVQSSGTAMRKAVSFELLDNMVSQGTILSMDAMADFIKENAKKEGLSGNAAIIIPDRLIVTRNITMPVMNESQLKYNLPFEFKDYLDDEKNKYFYDYAVKEMINDEEGKPAEMRLLGCVVRKETIAQYRQMLKRAGFNMKVAVPAVYAMERYIESADHFDKDGDYCLVNIGHETTTIYFYHGGEISSSRVIDVGIASIDRNYAQSEEVDVHIAHSHVISNYNDVLESEMAELTYNALAVEVMKAVNFFNYNNREAVLNEVRVLGGGALIPKLLDTMANVTGLTVRSAGDMEKGAAAGIKDCELYLQAFAATL